MAASTQQYRIPLSRPARLDEARENVNIALSSGWISKGPFVQEAQERLAEMTGRKYALCVSSGTTALIVALMAIREKAMWVKEWCAAIPSMTFAAVGNAVQIAGGGIVPCGHDMETWQVPLSEWEVCRNQPVDVLIPAPCYGGAAGLLPIPRPNQYIVMDAAESFGASDACATGDIACVSFYANKIVTSGGEGGACFTDDKDLFLRMKRIVNHGISGREYVVHGVGLNGRMTDLQAAVLCSQLDEMPGFLKHRSSIFAAYRATAKSFGWQLPDSPIMAPWLFAGIPPYWHSVVAKCEELGVEWRRTFPSSQTGSVAAYSRGMAVANYISKDGICLPLFADMETWEFNAVLEVIKAGGSK